MSANDASPRLSVAAKAAVGPDGPVLWIAMEGRRKALGIKWDGLHHSQTRSKIRAGILVRSDVTDDLDRDLRWVPGDANLAQKQGVSPRPIEGSRDATAEQRGRKLALVSKLNEVAMMVATSPDDVPEEVLADAERKANEIAERIRREQESKAPPQ
jgi:hypothetical protein